MQSQFKVLRSDVDEERHQWLKLWNEWPQNEPFAHPSYVESFCSPGQASMCATFATEVGNVLMPIILRPIDSIPSECGPCLFDVTGPYGYSGAFFWGSVDATAFWDDFDKWAIDGNVVSLFVRLSLFADSILPFRGTVRYVLDNIVRSLELNEDEMWMDYEQKVRKNVNKANRSGLEIEWDISGKRLDEFKAIYFSTLKRRGASASYFFSDSFFDQLIEGCPSCVVFIHALKEGSVISTELLLIGADHVYSFLGGTFEDFMDLRPNDFLKHEVIRWCRATGKQAFVLGGGVSPEDGIIRYKQAFAPNGGTVPFYVGERIFDCAANESLIQRRKHLDPTWEPISGYFPAYRSPAREQPHAIDAELAIHADSAGSGTR